MKKIVMACFAIALTGLVQAQQKQGRVVYEHTMELGALINGLSLSIPPAIVEVLFANDQSLVRMFSQEEDASRANSEGLRLHPSDLNTDQGTFTNLKTGLYLQQEKLFDKTYLIADTVRKLKWKLTGETKSILGYNCQQATAQRMSIWSQTNGVSGEVAHEEVQETVTVWFTPSIPVAAGPDMQGQLPGLMLELDINNGRVAYKAIELTAKVDLAAIKEPIAGTKVTAKEFARMRDEMFKQVNGNAGEGAIQMHK